MLRNVDETRPVWFTPVVKLWVAILALPVVGTRDSGRSQVVMGHPPNRDVETGATSLPSTPSAALTADAPLAEHLSKTVTAARLIWADYNTDGIRPQIVHVGVDPEDVVTKASPAGAVGPALWRRGVRII